MEKPTEEEEKKKRETRTNLTLSDEARAVLQGVPYHSRGAYVSALILADRGRSVNVDRVPHCRCGLQLDQVTPFDYGLWAASVDDLTAYKTRQRPAHDVIGVSGRRLRVGACMPASST